MERLRVLNQETEKREEKWRVRFKMVEGLPLVVVRGEDDEGGRDMKERGGGGVYFLGLMKTEKKIAWKIIRSLLSFRPSLVTDAQSFLTLFLVRLFFPFFSLPFCHFYLFSPLSCFFLFSLSVGIYMEKWILPNAVLWLNNIINKLNNISVVIINYDRLYYRPYLPFLEHLLLIRLDSITKCKVVFIMFMCLYGLEIMLSQYY